MTAPDHTTKPHENILHERGHPYMGVPSGARFVNRVDGIADQVRRTIKQKEDRHKLGVFSTLRSILGSPTAIVSAASSVHLPLTSETTSAVRTTMSVNAAAAISLFDVRRGGLIHGRNRHRARSQRRKGKSSRG